MSDFDLKITGGDVLDGLGNPSRNTDVGIRGDRIEATGDLSNASAAKTIQADGLSVAPGFIDIHAHGDVSILLCPSADSKLHDGVTTEISGNCGSSPFPMNDELRERLNRNSDRWGMSIDWSDFDGFARRVEKAGTAINRGFHVGHGTVRRVAAGSGAAQLTPRQFTRMKTLVAAAVDAGAFGLSTGLIYPPGCFATLKELIELASVAREGGGIYASHIRSEGDDLLEAIEEAAEIGRASHARIQVSHLKVSGKRNWHKIDTLLKKLASIRQEVDFAADRYPYTAGATSLSAMLPEWAHNGGHDLLMTRLKDEATRKRMAAEIADSTTEDTWHRVMLSGIRNKKRSDLQGMTVAALADQESKPPIECALDLLVEEDCGVGMIAFSMSEENLERILKLPFVAVASDATARATEGVTAEAMCHPRTFGTFSRALGRYVRSKRTLELPDAVRKMTSLPADRLGLAQRGRIAPGSFADITIFDPSTVSDTATYAEPMSISTGISTVIVNGEVAVADGKSTGVLNGRILRRQ